MGQPRQSIQPLLGLFVILGPQDRSKQGLPLQPHKGHPSFLTNARKCNSEQDLTRASLFVKIPCFSRHNMFVVSSGALGGTLVWSFGRSRTRETECNYATGGVGCCLTMEETETCRPACRDQSVCRKPARSAWAAGLAKVLPALPARRERNGRLRSRTSWRFFIMGVCAALLVCAGVDEQRVDPCWIGLEARVGFPGCPECFQELPPGIGTAVCVVCGERETVLVVGQVR